MISRHSWRLIVRRNYAPRLVRRCLIVNDFSTRDAHAEGLAKLRQSARMMLSVTEFITQYDELRQIHKFAGVEVVETPQMREGTRVHQVLELQTGVPATEFDLSAVFPEPVSPELVKYLELLVKIATLAGANGGGVREIRMRGRAPNGCLLRGIIDGIDLTPQGLVVTETKTTRSITLSSYQVRLAYHQALTYSWMLRTFLSAGSTHSLAQMFFITDDELLVLRQEFEQVFAAASAAIAHLRHVGVAPTLKLQFLKRVRGGYEEESLEVDYDEGVLNDVFRSRIDLFEGRRGAISGTLRDADAKLVISSNA